MHTVLDARSGFVLSWWAQYSEICIIAYVMVQQL